MAITNAPNQGAFSTNRANNGSVPLTRDASPIVTPNLSRYMHGDPGGSGPLTRMASPIVEPNKTKFADGDPGYTARPAAAVEPGKGSVPVNPFVAGQAGIVPSSMLRDSAKK